MLSGYLIANSIDADLSSRRFSYFRFYERRFFRLIPVLSVVIMCSFAAGYLLLLPEDLSNLGQEGITSLLFSSNFLFGSKVVTSTTHPNTACCYILGVWELKNNFIFCFQFCLLRCLGIRAGKVFYSF